MIINGIVDEHNGLWVKLKVSGYHSEKDIYFRIDTGFDGELSIPISFAVPLGLPLVGESSYNVAGGGQSNPLKFIASVQWGTKTKLVSADVDKTTIPLLGLGLIKDYVLTIDLKNRTLLIKEPEVKKDEKIAQEGKIV